MDKKSLFKKLVSRFLGDILYMIAFVFMLIVLAGAYIASLFFPVSPVVVPVILGVFGLFFLFSVIPFSMRFRQKADVVRSRSSSNATLITFIIVAIVLSIALFKL